MAKRKGYPKGSGFPAGTTGSKSKERGVGVPGQPKIVKLGQNWPVRFGHRFKKRSIRTLMKLDPAKDQAAQGKLTDVDGIDTGDSGGFKGGVRVIRKQPITPTAHAQTRVTAPVASGGKKVGGSPPSVNAISKFKRSGRR